ncbi:hypothetical protein Bca52824_064616 [Brassica carinata]|uniref:Uncharacterized protein n=1 Tax=Brassica carinata TaxID=52824 RepID=A0A8X7UAC7_BRACI|nr:hypothetical protein Bca52824_064616 [Brassica carinata]
MANSFIILADLKAGRCSTRAEEEEGLRKGFGISSICSMFLNLGVFNFQTVIMRLETRDKWAKEIDGNHSSGDSNEAGTKLGVHNINANSGFPETVDLVFYMDKNEKACDLRDIVICYKENILIMS